MAFLWKSVVVAHATACLSLGGAAAADMAEPMGPEHFKPFNIRLGQYNTQGGSPIRWMETSRTRDVYFSISFDARQSRNPCAVCAQVLIELARDDGRIPDFLGFPLHKIDAGCADARDASPSFTVTKSFNQLLSKSRYRWRTQVVLHYPFYYYDNGREWCERDEGIRPASDWMVGVGTHTPNPGYYSFQTP